jgi:capsid protein
MAAKKTTTKKPVKATTKHKRSVFSPDTTSRRNVRAGYDVARTTEENTNMWVGADSLSAAQANSPAVRKTIRDRARYEVANNSYADGIADTIAADTVGPQVQLQLGDSDLAQRTERDFMRWAKAINLWAKLRVMRRAKAVDGEVFGMLTTNRKVRNRVKLDLRLIETEMITSWTATQKDNEIDGIRFDDEGNPASYRVLNTHPSDFREFMKSAAGKWIASEFIIHYFTATRPGQVRGISELTPALSLFGELRSYTKAVVGCATRAAEISGVLETTLPPEGVAADVSPLTYMDSERNTFMSIPEGWKMAQLKAEQPTTTYAMFKAEIVNEVARCLSMPYNVAAGNSSGYNYASGRLDHQSYDRGIEVERAEIDNDILNRVFDAWLSEYRTVANMTTADMVAMAEGTAWYYSSRGHVDPKKEADADDIRLQNKTLTYKRYWASRGADGKREMQNWIDERVASEDAWNKTREAAGLDPAPFPTSEDSSTTSTSTTTTVVEDDDTNQGTDDEG